MRIAPCTNFKLIINDILNDVAVEKNCCCYLELAVIWKFQQQ